MAKKATKKQPDLKAAAYAIPGMIAAGVSSAAAGVSSAIDAGVATAKDVINDLQDGTKRPVRKAASPRKRAPKATTKSSSAKRSSTKS
ncbi:MAG TPA: hypothetical protein VIF63_06075 [Candidatus Limnocylindrales bacterium]|jgi:heterodisulfide reductase subunit A-like polyferredoxin